MGHSLCMQPWVNISATANAVIAQNDNQWLDLAGYQDAAIYLEVSQITAQGATTTFLNFQTAPAKEQLFFALPEALVARYTFTGTPTVGVQPVKIVLGPATQTTSTGLLGRYLRWQLDVGTVATSMNFRIWLNLNPAGW